MNLLCTSSSRFLSVFAITLSMAVSACSMKEQLDEMHDATVAVPKKLDGMKKTTDDMETTTCTMYRSLRQGNSKLSRDQDFEDIVRAEDISGKLAEAAEYMQGFEFQVWAANCDSELSRDEVIEQFAKELLAKMQGFTSDRETVGATKTSDKMQMLYALAATLHYENALQKNLLKGTEYAALRPLDVLVKGLEFDRARTRGEQEATQIPAYAAVVGKYQKDAVYLLRLRQNFLMAYAYALADSDSFGNSPNLMNKIVRIVKTDVMNRAWTPKLKNRTSTEIDERITMALDYAMEAHVALAKLGFEPMVDARVAELWERADFSEFNVQALAMSKNPGDRVFATSVKKLMLARDRIVTAWKRSSK
jgi:hypothetical protein